MDDDEGDVGWMKRFKIELGAENEKARSALAGMWLLLEELKS